MSEQREAPWAQMQTPAPGGTPDHGPALLDKVCADLQMDEEWIVRTPRTLTWWGMAAPMTFAVDDPRLIDDTPTIKITASITLLTDVTAASAQVLAVLSDLNRLASTGAFVWMENERRIEAFLTHYAYEGIEPITHLISAYALTLYIEAASHIQSLADTVGGSPNVVPHPRLGTREDYDEMLTFTDSNLLPAGQLPNRWATGQLEHLSEYLTENEIGISTGGASGLSVEFPLARNNAERWARLRSHFALGGEFSDDPISGYFTMPTSLGQIACVEHPTYGNGLLSILRFPVRIDGDGATFANKFNLGEYRGRTAVPALGAWCVDDDGDLMHNAFIPNAFWQDWVAPNLAFWSGGRTQWAFEAMAPDLLDTDARS